MKLRGVVFVIVGLASGAGLSRRRVLGVPTSLGFALVDDQPEILRAEARSR